MAVEERGRTGERIGREGSEGRKAWKSEVRLLIRRIRRWER